MLLSARTAGFSMSQKKLPTIQHPSSRLGDKAELNIRGDSRMAQNIALGMARVRRERTEPAMLSQSLPAALPPLSETKPWLGGRSLPREEPTYFSHSIYTSLPDRNLVTQRSASAGPQLGPYELLEVISEKLRTGFHSVRHLFKSNDPTGQGIVAREGLIKILYNLCGYLSGEQCNILLSSIGLEGKSTVSFEQFAGCFQDQQQNRTEWLNPVSRKELLEETVQRPCTAVSRRSGRSRHKARATPTPQHSPDRNNEANTEQPDKKEEPVTMAKDAEPVAKQRRSKSFRAMRNTVPKLERIMDCLHYRFEEPYNAMKAGFQEFDFLGEGLITRLDFRMALKEFGYPCQAIDMEQFLARCGLRILQGQVNYNDFLNKFWSRSENSLLNRIVTNSFHVFGQDHAQVASENLSVEDLEARLVDFFHGDFLALLGILKGCDKYELGVVKPSDLRFAVDKVIGSPMSESQWQRLQADLAVDKDNLIPYGPFLESFNAPPGQWNRRMKMGVSVAVVGRPETPAEVEVLREQAHQTLLQARQARHTEELKQKQLMLGRPADQLEQLVQDVFRDQFHRFDKAFKGLDRKMTGLFNKDQFKYLLKECGLEVSLVEVERLAKSMNLAQEGIFSYSALLRHFLLKEPVPVTPDKPMEKPVDSASNDTDTGSTKMDPLIAEKDTVRKQRDKQDPLEIIRNDVTSRWDAIISVLKDMDKAGTSLITAHDMKDLMTMFNFPVSDDEINGIISLFLVSPGSVNYVRFLEYFAKPGGAELLDRKVVAHKTSRANDKPSWQHKITRDWKVIKRAFKKADTENKGELGVSEFHRVLDGCGVTMSQDILFDILSQHDPHLRGLVNYERFLNHCLTAY